MTEKELIYGIICEILAGKMGVKISKLSWNTSINNDLGIEGDDAYEFIKFLEARLGYGINFISGEYFSGESLFSPPPQKNLTISNLVEHIIAD